MEPQVGNILEGKVTTITKFGAFVALEGGRSGLVHISEIANTYVNDVRDYLQEGQSVRVLVLPAENGKLNLSMKRVQPAPRPAAEASRRAGHWSPMHSCQERSFGKRSWVIICCTTVRIKNERRSGFSASSMAAGIWMRC